MSGLVKNLTKCLGLPMVEGDRCLNVSNMKMFVVCIANSDPVQFLDAYEKFDQFFCKHNHCI